MESQANHARGSRAERWIAVALCVAAALGRTVEHSLSTAPADGLARAPAWLPFAAAVFAAAGIVRLDGWRHWPRVQRASRWTALLLMVWAANGLPFDLLTMTGTMGRRTASGAIVIATVDWPGLAIRTLALAAACVLAHLALARPAAPASTRPAAWYGFAAFVLALPYPVLRAVWALGGTPGLSRPGAAGEVHGVGAVLEGRDSVLGLTMDNDQAKPMAAKLLRNEELNKAIDQRLKSAMAEAKKVVKIEFSKTQWAEFGITDKQ